MVASTAAFYPSKAASCLAETTCRLFNPLHLDCLRVCVCLQPSGVGTAQLSKSIFNFTDTQDVRVLVGCNAVINHKGDVVKVFTC